MLEHVQKDVFIQYSTTMCPYTTEHAAAATQQRCCKLRAIIQQKQLQKQLQVHSPHSCTII